MRGAVCSLLWEAIGGAEPLVLTGGNNCQTPLAVDKEWCYFHTINLSNFRIELLLLPGLYPPGWPMCK